MDKSDFWDKSLTNYEVLEKNIYANDGAYRKLSQVWSRRLQLLYSKVRQKR